jgi:large subunit ribosomal protein L18e
MKTKTKIEKQLKKKTNPYLAESVILAKKNPAWMRVAEILTYPKRNRPQINLEFIDKNAKEGEIIIIPGKVLSQGQMSKKVKVAALNFSESAKEKLLNSKCEVMSIIEEIKKNPSAKGIKILEK